MRKLKQSKRSKSKREERKSVVNGLRTVSNKRLLPQRNYAQNELEYFCMGGFVDVWLHPSKVARYKAMEGE